MMKVFHATLKILLKMECLKDLCTTLLQQISSMKHQLEMDLKWVLQEQ